MDTRLPINIIVFSKDRALQLELFLRSFNRCVKDADLYTVDILYTYSTKRFKEGYDKLFTMATPNMWFTKEENFKGDLVNLISPDFPYTVFFVDDIVFKEPFDFLDDRVTILRSSPDIACCSLRLHPYLTYCYALNKPMRQPTFLGNNVFNWTHEEGDYGYPMSQDGHIFRTAEILPFHKELDYKMPNELEGKLVNKRRYIGHNMICFDKAKIINNPINRVQDVAVNRCGNVSAEYLNDKFLEGYQIDLEPFLGLDNIAVHTEIEPTFIKI
jgi:hypothetical protein